MSVNNVPKPCAKVNTTEKDKEKQKPKTQPQASDPIGASNKKDDTGLSVEKREQETPKTQEQPKPAQDKTSAATNPIKIDDKLSKNAAEKLGIEADPLNLPDEKRKQMFNNYQKGQTAALQQSIQKHPRMKEMLTKDHERRLQGAYLYYMPMDSKEFNAKSIQKNAATVKKAREDFLQQEVIGARAQKTLDEKFDTPNQAQANVMAGESKILRDHVLKLQETSDAQKQSKRVLSSEDAVKYEKMRDVLTDVAKNPQNYGSDKYNEIKKTILGENNAGYENQIRRSVLQGKEADYQTNFAEIRAAGTRTTDFTKLLPESVRNHKPDEKTAKKLEAEVTGAQQAEKLKNHSPETRQNYAHFALNELKQNDTAAYNQLTQWIEDRGMMSYLLSSSKTENKIKTELQDRKEIADSTKVDAAEFNEFCAKYKEITNKDFDIPKIETFRQTQNEYFQAANLQSKVKLLQDSGSKMKKFEDNKNLYAKQTQEFEDKLGETLTKYFGDSVMAKAYTDMHKSGAADLVSQIKLPQGKKFEDLSSQEQSAFKDKMNTAMKKLGINGDFETYNKLPQEQKEKWLSEKIGELPEPTPTGRIENLKKLSAHMRGSLLDDTITARNASLKLNETNAKTADKKPYLGFGSSTADKKLNKLQEKSSTAYKDAFGKDYNDDVNDYISGVKTNVAWAQTGIILGTTIATGGIAGAAVCATAATTATASALAASNATMLTQMAEKYTDKDGATWGDAGNVLTDSAKAALYTYVGMRYTGAGANYLATEKFGGAAGGIREAALGSLLDMPVVGATEAVDGMVRGNPYSVGDLMSSQKDQFLFGMALMALTRCNASNLHSTQNQHQPKQQTELKTTQEFAAGTNTPNHTAVAAMGDATLPHSQELAISGNNPDSFGSLTSKTEHSNNIEAAKADDAKPKPHLEEPITNSPKQHTNSDGELDIVATHGDQKIAKLGDEYYILDDAAMAKAQTGDPDFQMKCRRMTPEAYNLYTNIQKQLDIKSPEDVQKMISNVQKATGATEEEAVHAITKMTQFASYGSFGEISKQMQDLGISKIYKSFDETAPVSLNTAFEYFNKKKNIQLNPDGDKTAFLLDESGIKELETLKQQGKLDEWLEMNPEVSFVNLDGWNTGTHILNNSGNIAETAIKNINEAKKLQQQTPGMTFETALNTLNDKGMSALGVPIHTIQTAAKQAGTHSAAQQIANQINPLNVSPLEMNTMLKAMAETLTEQSNFAPRPPKTPNADIAAKLTDAEKVLTSYFNSQLEIGTPENMSAALKDTHAKLQAEAANPDNMYYLIPERAKSYEWVAYQYAEVNGINKDRFIRNNGSDLGDKIPKDATVVVLDDISGSGGSMLYEGFEYANFRKDAANAERQVLFAPIKATEDAKYAFIDEMERQAKNGGTQDKLVLGDNGTIKPYKCDDPILLNKLIGDNSYGSVNAAMIFPTMGPDNNSIGSSFLAQFFVPNPTCLKATEKFNKTSILGLLTDKMKAKIGNSVKFPLHATIHKDSVL